MEKYSVTYTTPDGNVREMSVKNYGRYVRKDGSVVLYYLDTEDTWRKVDVLSYTGRIKDEYLRRSRSNRGKKSVLLGMSLGESIRVGRGGEANYSGWKTSISRYSFTGCRWSLRSDRITNEIVIRRTR